MCNTIAYISVFFVLDFQKFFVYVFTESYVDSFDRHNTQFVLQSCINVYRIYYGQYALLNKYLYILCTTIWGSFLTRKDKKDKFHSGNIYFDYGYKAYEMIVDELLKIKKLDERYKYKK